jgi:hypothetical protein
MRCEKTVLPLVSMQNNGSGHRALLFSSMTTYSHVHSVADLRVPLKAGPQISDWTGMPGRGIEG